MRAAALQARANSASGTLWSPGTTPYSLYSVFMRFVDIIIRKRDGGALSKDEIDQFVTGVTDGSVPDYQASALLMAIVLKGMTDEETGYLTDAMVRSGDRVDLTDIPGVKV